MLELNVSSSFKKDRRRCIKRGYNMTLLSAVIDTLLIPTTLPEEKKDQALTGDGVGFRECHILPDWLLIYRVEGNNLYLTRTGTHSNLFG